MSRVCVVCGNGKTTGRNVSHSNRRTNRTFEANVQKVQVEVNGKTTQQYMCTKCIKTTKKSSKTDR